jgi:hypothetical protein
VKDKQSVEIAYLINGDMISVRRLSARGEWRAGLAAFALVTALTAGGAALVSLVLLAAHRIVYVPAYVALWLLVGLGVASVAAARAVRRARSYCVGAGIDDDAFATAPLPLVRRARGGYRLLLIPGFSGRIENGRAPVPVESLVGKGAVDVPFASDGRAELRLGTGTFIVRAVSDEGAAPKLPAGVVRRFVRRSVLPLEMAAVASILCAVPMGAQIGDADMKSAIPTNATPWEIEKLLRWEAQTQARALHQCFDVLPIACQRPGYVGVGLSLSREGEIRSHWIARSTFGADCPVNQCMSNVISTWFFEPLPEPMKVILPVQVLRTDRPLPRGPARAAADLERSQERERSLARESVPSTQPARIGMD